MTFISIKASNGDTVWVNPDHIVAVVDKSLTDGCYVLLSNGTEIFCDENADKMTDYIIDELSDGDDDE